MSFTKITNSQLNSRGATTLPNQPTISPTALKEEFDAPAKNIVAPAVNNLIDELQAVTSAASLGAVAPTGRTGATVQALLTDISDDLATVETNSHTHANKTYIDKISEDGSGNPLYDGNPIGAGAAWGDITGTLSNQTDLQTALNGKANSSHTHTKSQITDLGTIPTKTSDLTNDSNFVADASYVHTDNNYDADAVSKKHSHSNKTVIDKFGEDSGGNPTYDGNPIGGGGQADAYKTIEAGGSSFVASGADTFKINAGSNVTITPLTGDKGIQISASGGGTSTGDMLMADYDSAGTVKNTTGGIVGYVAGEIGKLDVSDSAVSGQYVSAVSETDGKISVSRTALPTIPTVVNTYSSTGTDAISGTGVNAALETLDVTDTAVSGQYVSAVSETDGKISVTRANLPTMINNSGYESTMVTHAADPTDDDVASAYVIANWSNCAAKVILTTVAQGDDTVGQWNDTWKTDGVRTGWLWSADLYHVLEDGSGNRNYDVEVIPVFDAGDSETISLYGYRIDDDVTNGGTPGGAIAFKLNSAVQSATGVKVGVKLVLQRTEVNPTGTIIT